MKTLKPPCKEPPKADQATGVSPSIYTYISNCLVEIFINILVQHTYRFIDIHNFINDLMIYKSILRFTSAIIFEVTATIPDGHTPMITVTRHQIVQIYIIDIITISLKDRI